VVVVTARLTSAAVAKDLVGAGSTPSRDEACDCHNSTARVPLNSRNYCVAGLGNRRAPDIAQSGRAAVLGSVQRDQRVRCRLRESSW
jgi:hypothetical protein